MGLVLLKAIRDSVTTVIAEEASRAGVVGVVFDLGPVEPGGAVNVYNGKARLLTEFKVLASEEE